MRGKADAAPPHFSTSYRASRMLPERRPQSSGFERLISSTLQCVNSAPRRFQCEPLPRLERPLVHQRKMYHPDTRFIAANAWLEIQRREHSKQDGLKARSSKGRGAESELDERRVTPFRSPVTRVSQFHIPRSAFPPGLSEHAGRLCTIRECSTWNIPSQTHNLLCAAPSS